MPNVSLLIASPALQLALRRLLRSEVKSQVVPFLGFRAYGLGFLKSERPVPE